MATKQLGTAASNSTDAVTKAYADALTGTGGSATPSFKQLVGDGTSGPFTITHNLGTRDVAVDVFKYGQSSTWENILVRVDRATPNTVILRPDDVWAANSYKVLVRFVDQSDVIAPTTPAITYVSKDTGSITVQLATASTDADSGVAGYYAYVGSVRQGSLTPYVLGDNITVGALTSNTSYSIKITAVDREGNESAFSNVITQTTNAIVGDTTAPTAGVASFSSSTSNSLTYAFTAGADNVGVSRVDAYDADGTTLLASNVTSPYTRGSLTSATSYGTLFRYFDAAGNHADSNTVTHSTDSVSAVAFSAVNSAGRTSGTNNTSDTVVVDATGGILLVFGFTSDATWGSIANFTTLTASSSIDGSLIQKLGPSSEKGIDVGPSGQEQGAICCWYKLNPSVGTHTVSVQMIGPASPPDHTMMCALFYHNVTTIDSLVLTRGTSSTSTPSVTIPSNANNMTVCAILEATNAPGSGYNRTARWNNGAAVSGQGDFAFVGDWAGASPSVVHSSSVAQRNAVIGVNLEP